MRRAASVYFIALFGVAWLGLAAAGCSNSEDNGEGEGSAGGGAQGAAGDGDHERGGSGNSGSSGSTGETPPGPESPPSCDTPSHDAADFAAVYDVGPGYEHESPSDVPWESIQPSTLVRIHWREAPYADKWDIAVRATEDEPVVVLGVPSNGRLPEITGVGATTRSALDYWSDTRGIIKIGGSSVPDVETAAHVTVECLDISGARTTSEFTDETGSQMNYDDNASAVFLESGEHITLRNNRFHDCGNGLFVANASSDVLVSGNQIFDNGNVDSAYEHNSYTEAQGIVFEFNHYGELCSGCSGNNLKDRSSGLVVRYNFIEGGNRALDLVDSDADSIYGAPDYHDSLVYGNVLIEREGGNRQIIHYGGDNDESTFRTGTLYFYHNTVISERSGLAVLVRLSSEAGALDARDNIFFSVSGGSNFGILEDAGSAALSGNWLPSGWQEGSPSFTGTVTAMDNREGQDPGFTDADAGDYTLNSESGARGIIVPLASEAAAYPVTMQFSEPSSGAVRATTENAGAFE